MLTTIILLVIAFVIMILSKMYFHKKCKDKKFNDASFKVNLLTSLTSLIVIFLISLAAIRPYLMSNPEILQDMIVKMQMSAQKDQSSKISKYVKKNKKEMEENAPFLGNANADVTIYLYYDYTCSACKMADRFVEELLAKDNNVKVVLKAYPIRQFSVFAAQAVVAAKIQSNDKAAALHRLMMAGNIIPQNFSQSWDANRQQAELKKVIMDYADQVGLNTDKLEADMNGETVAKEMNQTRVSGNEFGLEGTPFFVIGSKFYPGALTLAELENAVKEAR
jgi:protein-disulfide isomerase